MKGLPVFNGRQPAWEGAEQGGSGRVGAVTECCNLVGMSRASLRGIICSDATLQMPGATHARFFGQMQLRRLDDPRPANIYLCCCMEASPLTERQLNRRLA